MKRNLSIEDFADRIYVTVELMVRLSFVVRRLSISLSRMYCG